MKKTILFLLVLSLCAGMVFAGGGQQAASGTSGGGTGVTTQVTPKPLTVKPQYGDQIFYPQPATSYTTNPAYPQQPAVSNVNGFPITQNKVDLKIATPYYSYVQDYENNDIVKYMEELTNVHIVWDLLPEVGTLDRINIQLAAGAGSLPDVYLSCGLPATLISTAGAGKLFIPLQDFVARDTYNYKRMLESDKSMQPVSVAFDGNSYSIASYGRAEPNQTAMRFWINTKFLDKLGMKMPTTTEEYYEYLKAVKTRDPNGNGKADEIPLVGATEGWHAEIDGFLMNAFIYNETSTGTDTAARRRMYITDDGKIDVTYNKPGWREGLEYLRRLCSEGLLAPESFTLRKEELRALVEIAGEPIVGSLPNGGPHEFANTQGERRKDFAVVAPLKGPKGIQQIWYDEYLLTSTGHFVITSDCKIPDVAMKWVDYWYTPDMSTRNRYGVLGRDWKIPPAGTMGVDGTPAKYEEILRWGTPQTAYLGRGFGWGQFGSYNRAVSPDPFELEKVLWDAYVLYKPYWFRKSVPRTLPFNVQESRDFATLNQVIVEYVDQFLAQVVTGRMELNDTTWNKYVSDIDNMGLPRLLAATQSAFDRSWAEALGYK